MPRRYTETAHLSEGHDTKGITCVGFNTDGTLLATGGMDGNLCIWDAETGKLLHKYVTVSAVPITSLGWIEAKRPTVMIGNKNGNLIVVVINKGEMSSSGFWAHRFPIERIAIQGDLVASGACSELKVWKRSADDTYKWAALIQEPPLESSEGNEVLVTGVQWISSDKYGQLLMAAYMFHGVQLVETATWKRVVTVPIEGKIASASVSEDGTCIVVSNLTTGFDVYLVDSGELLRSFEHDVGECLPTPVLFIHNGQAVVGGTTVGKVNMWDLDRGKMPTLPIPNRGRVLAIAVGVRTPVVLVLFLITQFSRPMTRVRRVITVFVLLQQHFLAGLSLSALSGKHCANQSLSTTHPKSLKRVCAS
ncbi:WD40-repeat-containing domain protein [Ganoderma leucocontextum]|nr:WD40-repeat-containing domain protein [Ganoderma leucocontextum]